MEEKIAEWEAKKESGKSENLYAAEQKNQSLVFELFDERDALERALLHFAHFEKEAERLDKRHYRIKLKYNKEDEAELVIRVLSFGPFLRVVEPEIFVSFNDTDMTNFELGGITKKEANAAICAGSEF